MRAAEIRGAKEQRRAVRGLTVRLVLLGFVYVLFIQCTGTEIPYLFRLVTGYRCLGYDMTHAAMALLRGQSRTAWRENPLNLTVVPFLVFYGTYRVEVYIRIAYTDPRGWEILFLGVLWAVVLLFQLLGNLQTSL